MATEAAEKTGKDKGMTSRNLTEAEISEMHGDTTPPEGYANDTLVAPEELAVGEEAAPEAGEQKPAAKEAAKPAGEQPPTSGDVFEKLEAQLQQPEGKEDLTAFSAREKAYFHQMRRDRKARQKAEEERDIAARRALKAENDLKNPPPPPPDPLEGLADDDVISVKEARERLAKLPKPAEKQPEAPAAPAVSPQQARYLALCEKEARAAHADFDAVMELAEELVAGDQTALREIGEQVAKGENPAIVMYQTIRKHKDFEALLPAAEVRAKARAKASAAPATPASPSAPAPATPEDKAKEDKAKQAEKALEENNNRTRTTAHVSAREGKPADELTEQEISAMPDLEFAKLPRHVRQRYLKKYGG